MRIAVPLAIPTALGLALGIFIAVSGGSHGTTVRQTAAGAAASASAAATSTAAAGTTLTANSFSTGFIAHRQLGDVATRPVSGAAGATPINLNQTPAQAAASMNCGLIVPANPLSAQGLATPYQLTDGCSMANFATEGAFAEATILAPNGTVTVYNPLVITAGTTPAVKPVAPAIAAGSTVIISFGFNGTNLFLTGPGARQGNCVDALGQSLIGQVSQCNAVNFYNRANADIANGTLKINPVGTSLDGQPCLTTRNFATIDQDQSDNVITSYLINGNGQTAQDSTANAAAVAGSTVIVNGSDDKLLAAFLDPANGCTAQSATDNTEPGGTSGSQALNELSARVNQAGTTALNPVNDEMTLVNGQFSVAKTNVYRSLVDQPLLAGNVNPTLVAASYCQNLVNIQPERNQLDMARELNFTSPVPAVGTNLATFEGNRLSMSFTNLNCGNFGLTNPVTVTLNGQGVATAVTYNLTQQTAKINGVAISQIAATSGRGRGMRMNAGAGQSTGTQARGSRRGRFQNPSGQ
jgi:hypothetical protein